jgi:hypothetical protein
MKLKLGASVLAGAEAIEPKWTRDGLPRFAQVHRGYVDAQRKVDAAQSALKAARARVRTLHTLQSHAVHQLARALIVDGCPFHQPFKPFSAPSPSTIGRLPNAEGAAAVAQLVAAVVRRPRLSDMTRQSTESALAASRAVEEALAAVAKREEDVRSALRTRDAVGVLWDTAVRRSGRGCSRRRWATGCRICT